MVERFLFDLETKARKQNRHNKRKEIEQFDWCIDQIQTFVAFYWLSELSGEKFHALELSRNQRILHLDVILQHDWPIEQYVLHIRIFFGGKTKSPCFDLFVHWLIKQITNTYQNHFSRSCENRSILCAHFLPPGLITLPRGMQPRWWFQQSKDLSSTFRRSEDWDISSTLHMV